MGPSPSKKSPLRTLDLFSGIGGFSLGLQGTARTVAYCEIDAKCRSVLRKNIREGHLDDAPIFEDVRKLGVRELAPLRPEMITAGFPCQDISSNNNDAQGLRGSRSSLVWQVLRIVREVPGIRHIFLENSPMILHKGLPDLLKRFEKEGFSWAWGIFAATEVGAPHERRRWYCLLTRGQGSPQKIRLLTSVTRLPWTPDWRRDLPVSKRVTVLDPTVSIRFSHLGNSVVPQVIHLAFVTLAASHRFCKSTPEVQPVKGRCGKNLLDHVLVLRVPGGAGILRGQGRPRPPDRLFRGQRETLGIQECRRPGSEAVLVDAASSQDRIQSQPAEVWRAGLSAPTAILGDTVDARGEDRGLPGQEVTWRRQASWNVRLPGAHGKSALCRVAHGLPSGLDARRS